MIQALLQTTEQWVRVYRPKLEWALDPTGFDKQHQPRDTDGENYRARSEDGSDKAVLTRIYLGAYSREPTGLKQLSDECHLGEAGD